MRCDPAVRSGGAAARRWIAESGNPAVRHRAGVAWRRSRIPARWHLCRPQTVELYYVRCGDGWELTGRCWCACGAVTDTSGTWRDRNKRRGGRHARHKVPVGWGGEGVARVGPRRTAAPGPRAPLGWPLSALHSPLHAWRAAA